MNHKELIQQVESVVNGTVTEEESKSVSTIKALEKEDFKTNEDFFKLAQMIKGLAGAAGGGDKTAAKFLAKLGDAIGKSVTLESLEPDDEVMEALEEELLAESVKIVDREAYKSVLTPEGRFKEGFTGCVKFFSSKAVEGVTNPQGLCAKFSRRKKS